MADLDVLVGNWDAANQLFVNDGTGTLTEDTSSAIAVGTDSTYVVFAADMDNDGGARDVWDAHATAAIGRHSHMVSHVMCCGWAAARRALTHMRDAL